MTEGFTLMRFFLFLCTIVTESAFVFMHEQITILASLKPAVLYHVVFNS